MSKKVFISLVALVIIASACGGPQFPFDTGYQDSADLAQEFEEGRREAEELDRARKNDPCLDDKLSGVPPELQRCGNWRDREPSEYEQEFEDRIDEIAEDAGWTSGSGEGCPNGCTTHKSGCDIKGNISYNTKERIYHVPGQNFYNETKISSKDGERWFCTEAEARANGWRKAKN